MTQPTRPRSSAVTRSRAPPSSLWILLVFHLLVASLPIGCFAVTTTCPSGCTCESIAVKCGQKNITDIPADFPANDTVTHLTVSRTSLTRVAPRFENLRELRTVDLNTNQIDEIAEGAFRNLSKLESLVLRRNNISVVTSVTFLGMPSLRHLDLSYNKLVQLVADCFQELTGLDSLDLTRNEIETIDKDAFAGLRNLKVLNLSHNMLPSIGGNLSPLSNLETMLLDDNSIQVLCEDDLAPLVSLKTLSLDGNRLMSIDMGAFGKLNDRGLHLETLSLRGTALSEVPVGVFQGVVYLKNLDLSKSEILAVHNETFSGLQRLVSLVLDNLPKLTYIAPRAFNDLASLQRLVITNNLGVSDLGAGMFRNLSSLRVLDLHGNAIRHFDQGLADWEAIDIIDLSQNPVECDCHAVWMLSLMDDPSNETEALLVKLASFNGNASSSSSGGNRHEIRFDPESSTKSKTETIECSDPLLLKGRLLTSLKPSDFRCDMPVENTHPTTSSPSSDAAQRFKVGIIAASVACVLLACGAVFVKFRRRICSFCRRQYRYQAYKGTNLNGQSHTLADDAVEMERTEMEDLDSLTETIDTTLKS